MGDLIIVGLGGFLGSISRYYIGGLIFHVAGSPRFPISTLLINVTGCFAIGILSGLAEHFHFFSPQARLFLLTGILGGFTTFSAFGYEAIYLMRIDAKELAFLYVFLSVLLGLVSTWIGIKIITQISNG